MVIFMTSKYHEFNGFIETIFRARNLEWVVGSVYWTVFITSFQLIFCNDIELIDNDLISNFSNVLVTDNTA